MQYELINQRNQKLTLKEQVFRNRGFNLQDIEHYLNTTDKDILPPSLMANIKQGAQMLIKHIKNEDDVLIIIDSDADGYTSSALLINYLYTLFPAFVLNHISYKIHLGKEHGIFLDGMNIDNIKLIICPDSSSNEFEKHQILSEKNIDILVLDHHEADKVSEYACIINNQLCDYPTKSLCGVGVVYKFCCYLDELLTADNANNFIDLVALGEIGDIMDITNFEVKRIITKGLNNIKNPFFYTMVQKQNYSISKAGGINPFSIAFYIVPQINATIRMGNQHEKQLLFESMLSYKAYEKIPSTKRGCRGQEETVVEQACRNCNNIKNHQTKELDSNLEIIKQQIQDNKLYNNKIIAIISPEGQTYNSNLIGLMANKIMGEYQRPVLLLNYRQHKDGSIWLEGSGRGYSKSKLKNFRSFLIKQGIEDLGGYAQGHQGAFGFGIQADKFDNFINKCYDNIKDIDFNTFYKVDCIFNNLELDCSLDELLEIGFLNDCWGTGLEEPLFAFHNISLTDKDIILMSPDKNPTLKIKFSNGLDCIKFKSSQEEVDLFLPPTSYGCTNVDIVGKIQINEWNGQFKPQLIIEDYNILNKNELYF